MEIPEGIRKSLDCIEQSVGELVYLREVIESMKSEDAKFVDRHARKIAEGHLPIKNPGQA